MPSSLAGGYENIFSQMKTLTSSSPTITSPTTSTSMVTDTVAMETETVTVKEDPMGSEEVQLISSGDPGTPTGDIQIDIENPGVSS